MGNITDCVRTETRQPRTTNKTTQDQHHSRNNRPHSVDQSDKENVAPSTPLKEVERESTATCSSCHPKLVTHSSTHPTINSPDFENNPGDDDAKPTPRRHRVSVDITYEMRQEENLPTAYWS